MELRAPRAKARLVDESVPAMVWAARPDMSCEYLSNEWLRFTGLAEEQALGDGWARAVHPEDLARWLDACVRAFDAREPLELDYRLRRHDGEYRWVRDRGAPRLSADGGFLGFAGACVDIDDCKRIEHDLAHALERERRLRVAIEKSPLDGVRVLVVDDDAGERETMMKVLGIAGAETQAACSSAEALDALPAFHPDVLLSDLAMRNGAGYELIRAVRALPAERGGCMRAAALMGSERPEDQVRAVTAGYDAQLAKPVEPLSLLAMIARLAQPLPT